MNSLTWAGLQVVGELCSLRASEPSVVVPHHCRRFGGGRRGHSLVLWLEAVLAPVSVWGQTELHAHHENHRQEFDSNEKILCSEGRFRRAGLLP